MGVRLTKRWVPITPDALRALPGQLGVFELADAGGRVLLIGCAGGRSLFGLRGEISAAAESVADARSFRYEVTTAYLTRYLELLMAHRADHGALPPVNEERGSGGSPRLGRLSPG